MGNTQESQHSPPKPDDPKADDKRDEKSTQTEGADQSSETNETENEIQASNNDDSEGGSQRGSDIPENPPPYTRHDEECSDDTSVKRDLSSESKKEPQDNQALDDLKLTIEKRFIDCNDRLDSLEKSLERNFEQQQEASDTLLDLKDTVYTHFEMSKEDGNTTSKKEASNEYGQFTERVGRHVVEHLLRNEQIQTLIGYKDEDTGSHDKSNDVEKSIVCQPVSEDSGEENVVRSTIPLYSRGNNSLDRDDDNESKGFVRHTKNRNTIEDGGEVGTVFRIDPTAWSLCIMMTADFEHEAEKLLNEGVLPDEHLLAELYDKLGRKSSVFQDICNCICHYIKSRSTQILDVWAAYRCDKGFYRHNTIIFVVLKNEQDNIDIKYETCQRCLHEISDNCELENSKIQREENKIESRELQMEGVTKCLKSNSRALMKKHSNLRRVTFSWIKSSGFGSKTESLEPLPCIALYVQVKGLIPISKDPFEEYIGEYPVDVREGVFTLLGSPTDLHQNVRMGCALDSGFGSDQGTVGPFFRFETDSHIYLLTCAHVLLNPEQMKTLIKDKKMHYGLCGNDAYQPPESTTVVQGTRYHLGKIELALYKEGDETMSGMEIVLVKINENRIPVDGKFPDSDSDHCDFGIDDPFEFPIERICDLSNMTTCSDVYKFGAITGLQKGKVRLQGSSVRTDKLIDNSMGFDFVLHQQIEIEDINDNIFAVKGDSGSLVLKRENGHLSAVGILEGKMGNCYMVTPICDIKQALSEYLSMHRDPPSGNEMDIEENLCEMAMKLNYVPRNVTSIQQTGVYDDIDAAIARQTTNLQTQIMQSTDHKIRSVKSELTVIKQHIDNTKNEIKIDIQQMENRVTENISRQIERLFMNLQSQGKT